MLANGIDMVLTHAMPLLLRAMIVHVLFSGLACIGSNLSPAVAGWFGSMRAKSLPFFVFVALFALAGLA